MRVRDHFKDRERRNEESASMPITKKLYSLPSSTSVDSNSKFLVIPKRSIISLVIILRSDVSEIFSDIKRIIRIKYKN